MRQPVLLCTAAALALSMTGDALAQGGKARRLKGPGPFWAANLKVSIPLFERDIAKSLCSTDVVRALDRDQREFVDHRFKLRIADVIQSLSLAPETQPGPTGQARLLFGDFAGTLSEGGVLTPGERDVLADFFEVDPSRLDLDNLLGFARGFVPESELLKAFEQPGDDPLTMRFNELEGPQRLEVGRRVLAVAASTEVILRAPELDRVEPFGLGFLGDARAYPAYFATTEDCHFVDRSGEALTDRQDALDALRMDRLMRRRRNPYLSVNVGIAKNVGNPLDYGDSDVSRSMYWLSVAPTIETRHDAGFFDLTLGTGLGVHFMFGEMFEDSPLTRVSWRGSIGGQWKWIWVGYQFDYFPSGFDPSDFGALGPDRDGGELIHYFPFANFDVGYFLFDR